MSETPEHVAAPQDPQRDQIDTVTVDEVGDQVDDGDETDDGEQNGGDETATG